MNPPLITSFAPCSHSTSSQIIQTRALTLMSKLCLTTQHRSYNSVTIAYANFLLYAIFRLNTWRRVFQTVTQLSAHLLVPTLEYVKQCISFFISLPRRIFVEYNNFLRLVLYGHLATIGEPANLRPRHSVRCTFGLCHEIVRKQQGIF